MNKLEVKIFEIMFKVILPSLSVVFGVWLAICIMYYIYHFFTAPYFAIAGLFN